MLRKKKPTSAPVHPFIYHSQKSVDLDCFPTAWHPTDAVNSQLFFDKKPIKHNSAHYMRWCAYSLKKKVYKYIDNVT